MTNRILLSAVGAILLLAATTALARAWPDQPPDKVLISGPGIEAQVEVKDRQELEIFRLGKLEDLQGPSPKPAQVSGGYKIVRFFYGGEFDFARLTYYPNPDSGRGLFYFEDGPMLQGDHTPYDRTWLYANPDAEKQLGALLKQLGAKLDGPAPAGVAVSGSASGNPVQHLTPVGANANAASDSPGAARPGQTNSAQTGAAGEMTLPASGIIALLGAVGVLAAAGILLVRRARDTQGSE